MDVYGLVETAWGIVVLGQRDGKLARLWLPSNRPAQLLKRIVRRWPNAKRRKNIFPNLARQIRYYFQGKPVAFDVPVDLSDHTPFRRAVLSACANVLHGTTRTYGQLATAVGHPGAARAVGAAMANNPIPLVIPCHRIVRSDGKLGGFSAEGGPRFKKAMLELEAGAG